MAISSTYCTHRDLEDVYPQISEFDSKAPVYGFTSLGNNIYIAYNTGLITQLFIDGQEANAAQSSSGNFSYQVRLQTAISSSPQAGYGSSSEYSIINYTTSFESGSETDIKPGSYISVGLVNTEVMYIQSIDTDNNKLTVLRGALGTTPAAWTTHTDNKVTEYLEVNTSNAWYYDEYLDHLLVYSATDLNDQLVEAGEDYKTLITRTTKNASRYVDSRIDAGIPRDAFKDKEGNYDYFLIRTTSLVSAYFLINSTNPNSEVANKFLEEANFNIDQINTGKTKLSYQVSGDSSSGVLREVKSPQAANGLYIVDTRGHYSGIYDLMKIIITTAGAIGVAKFDVYHGDDTGLKKNKVVDAELITGDYQSVGGSLQVRFSGSTDASVATVDDEWELECWGQYESLDGSPGSSTNTRLTRRGY